MLSGRFAPSPTGPLHMGSLITALASYLDITSQGGSWHIRIDDIDGPREAPEARSHIINTLAAHGLHSASTIRLQSNSTARFRQALDELSTACFYCRCSRAQLREHDIYPGHCRALKLGAEDAALRLRVSDDTPVQINDGLLPSQTTIPSRDIGDFIVRRRDGLWAYNFATAVDDGHDFTHVFRGQDLRHTTAMQVYVMHKLKLPVPQYTHLPLLCFPDGDKLSKQTHAPALDAMHAAHNLAEALYYLGFNPPVQPTWTVGDWLGWALARWPTHSVPAQLPFYRPNPVLT
ncbi:MAG: tRNA glutamyl-Q(34) synthetase GluQRS [Pseudomonadales bacterium]